MDGFSLIFEIVGLILLKSTKVSSLDSLLLSISNLLLSFNSGASFIKLSFNVFFNIFFGFVSEFCKSFTNDGSSFGSSPGGKILLESLGADGINGRFSC